MNDIEDGEEYATNVGGKWVRFPTDLFEEYEAQFGIFTCLVGYYNGMWHGNVKCADCKIGGIEPARTKEEAMRATESILKSILDDISEGFK